MVIAAKTHTVPNLIPAPFVVDWDNVRTFDNSELSLANGACLAKFRKNTWPESSQPAEPGGSNPTSQFRWGNLSHCGWMFFFDCDRRPP